MKITILRWTARLLGTFMFLFFAFMFFADLFGVDESPRKVALSAIDIIHLSLMWISVIGLMISWKKELIGALITIIAFITQGIISPRLFEISLLYLPSLNAILFIVIWWLSRKEEVQ